MNSNNPSPPAALAALESWLDSLRGDGGYTGPVAGLRGECMAWCGPSHDWRWEGLLDGWVARHRATANPIFLDHITRAMLDLRGAQLADGSFRNSSFEHNPLEGGMPHEPAVMAAVLRAMRYLRGIAHNPPEGASAMVERFVEERLLKSLWTKTPRTFNNWLQSDFETYSPPAVASIVEVLLEYGDLTGSSKRFEPFLTGAADSLLRLQFRDGPLAGALPASSMDRASASPFLAARCLPALAGLRRATGEDRFGEAGDRLAGFVMRGFQRGGGIASMVFAARPPRVAPLFTGATAGALLALDRAGRRDDALRAQQIGWLLARQTPSGGFDTAVGFGSGLPPADPPDWRDALPAFAWATHVYALLADQDPAPATAPAPGEVRRSVRVRGRPAEMMEDIDKLEIRSRSEPLYAWRKRTAWADVCHL